MDRFSTLARGGNSEIFVSAGHKDFLFFHVKRQESGDTRRAYGRVIGGDFNWV
jgi:hypothetical protein